MLNTLKLAKRPVHTGSKQQQQQQQTTHNQNTSKQTKQQQSKTCTFQTLAMAARDESH